MEFPGRELLKPSSACVTAILPTTWAAMTAFNVAGQTSQSNSAQKSRGTSKVLHLHLTPPHRARPLLMRSSCLLPYTPLRCRHGSCSGARPAFVGFSQIGGGVHEMRWRRWQQSSGRQKEGSGSGAGERLGSPRGCAAGFAPNMAAGARSAMFRGSRRRHLASERQAAAGRELRAVLFILFHL